MNKKILSALKMIIPLFMLSCSEPSEPLRMASSPWPGYEPLYMARDLNYFTPQQVNYYELPSADITLEAFRNHSTDLATLTLDEVLELLQSGIKLRIVSVIDSSNSADAAMALPSISSLSQIKGKRIAVENITLGLYMLSRMLNKANLNHDDIEIIHLAENKHEEFYQQNKADVIITMQPFKSQLSKLGAHSIFDSSMIPNEILDLLVVHEDVYQERRNDVCNLAKQWFKALDYINNNSENAYKNMGKRLEKTPEELKEMTAELVFPTLNENLGLLSGDSPKLFDVSTKLSQVMVAEKLLSNPIILSKENLIPDIQSCIQ
jgi:NitT/TauT family transport system substrate-binding protein